jgi:hypothetical protein
MPLTPFTLPILLSGCFSMTERLVLNEDGSGTVRIEVFDGTGAMQSVQMLGGLAPDEDDDDPSEKEKLLAKLKKDPKLDTDTVGALFLVRPYEIWEVRHLLKKKIRERTGGAVELTALNKETRVEKVACNSAKNASDKSNALELGSAVLTTRTIIELRFKDVNRLKDIGPRYFDVSMSRLKSRSGFEYRRGFTEFKPAKKEAGARADENSKPEAGQGEKGSEGLGAAFAFIGGAMMAQQLVRFELIMPAEIESSNACKEEGRMATWDFPGLDLEKGKVKLSSLWVKTKGVRKK